MAPSFTHCPNCAAEIKRQDSTICPMCAFPLLEEGPTEVKSTSADAERFQTLKDHKNFKLLMGRLPGRVDPRDDGKQLVLVGVALIPLGLLVALLVNPFWIGLVTAAAGAAVYVFGSRARNQARRAPVQKLAAMLSSEPSGGRVVPVTFELSDGTTQTLEALAGAVVEGPKGSMGVAYVRHGKLEEFRRIDV